MADMELSGSENTAPRWAFLLLDFLVYLFLFWASIGATAGQKDLLWFYIFFGAVLGTGPYIVDLVTKAAKSEPSEYIDTVALEDEQMFEPLASPKVQIGIGLVIAGLVAWQMLTTSSMWIAYPQFGVFSSPVGNAILAAVSAGYVETIVFFRFLMPTLARIGSAFTESDVIGIMIAIILTTACFTGYHMWIYKYSEQALLSVVMFSLGNCMLVLMLRSVVSNITWHFTNNAIAHLTQVVKFVLSVVV